MALAIARLLAGATAQKGKPLSLRIVRLGSDRAAGEGLRIGTVRRPPRGLPKSEYAKRNIYDVWFPNLSPSEALLKTSWPVEPKDWPRFRRAFLKEMKAPESRRALELLAAFSHQTNFSVGCYCEVESLCHRSLLRHLFEELGADIV